MTAPRRSPWDSPAVGLLASLALGVAVGFAARAGHELAREPYWMASLGGPWLVAAFAAGALAGDRRVAALAGAATIVTGTFTYYSLLAVYHGVMYLSIPTAHADYGVAMTIGWSAAGLAIGAGFGAAGALWRRGGASLWAAGGAAALGGALAGEALLLHAAWSSPWAQRVLALELATGVVVAVALARGRRAAALALTIPFAAVFVVCAGVVRETLRAAGWAGA